VSHRNRGRRDARRSQTPATATTPRGSEDDVEVSRALLLGRIMALLFVAVAVLLLLLAALGRGTPYLLGALDFAAIGGALAWIGWRDPGGRAHR
jgi:hypothetical protein